MMRNHPLEPDEGFCTQGHTRAAPNAYNFPKVDDVLIGGENAEKPEPTR